MYLPLFAMEKNKEEKKPPAFAGFYKKTKKLVC
jgi:hypothetical protein